MIYGNEGWIARTGSNAVLLERNNILRSVRIHRNKEMIVSVENTSNNILQSQQLTMVVLMFIRDSVYTWLFSRNSIPSLLTIGSIQSRRRKRVSI